MRIKIPLLAVFFATLSLSLASCDTDALVNSASDGASSPGGVSFGLDAQVIATVQSTVDSLRLELRQGTVVRSQAVALDSSVRVSDLAAGRWFISVGLYNKQGVLKYYGSDSVTVVAGEVAKADIGLKPAKGSVDISIHLDSTTIDTLPLIVCPVATNFLGTWLLQEVAGTPVYDRSISLVLTDSGSRLSGTDGCNFIFGFWTAGGRDSLRFQYANTFRGCFDSSNVAKLPMALENTRGWKLVGGQLWLLDSLGGVLAKYGTYVLHPTGALPDTLVRQVVPEAAVDTSSLKLATVSILGLQKQDSFLVLTVQLPHPNVKVRLLNFTYVDEICSQPNVSNDTLSIKIGPDTGCVLVYKEYFVEPPQRLLVIGEESDSTADAQGPVVAKLRIPRSSLTRTQKVYFIDRTGKQVVSLAG